MVCLPFILPVTHSCTTTTPGPHPCDGRRDLTLLRARFPAVDFTLAELDLKRQQHHFPQLRQVLQQALAASMPSRPEDPPHKGAVQQLDALCLSDGGAEHGADNDPDTPNTPSPPHELSTPAASAILRHNSSGPYDPATPRMVTVETEHGTVQRVPVREFDAQSIENGEDLVWQALRSVDCISGCYGEGESEADVCARGVQLIHWLAARCVVVVVEGGVQHESFVVVTGRSDNWRW